MVNQPPGCSEQSLVNPCTSQTPVQQTQTPACVAPSDDDCSIFIPISCAGWNIEGSCTWSPPSPPVTCPSGFINCATCGCMPNTQTCNYWIANSCANSNANSGGSTACTTGDCFTDISNCGQVGRPNQTGTCTGGICCAFGGSTPECSVEFQAGPSTVMLGTSAQFTAFARGAIEWWDGSWGWRSGDTARGTFSPTGAGTGPTFTTTFTANTVGYSQIRFGVTEDNGTFKCEGFKDITVTPFVCTPNCPVGARCGQSDGCGGFCTNVDSGPPNAVITSPADASSFTPTGNQFTVYWTNNGSLQTDQYQIEILPDGITCATAATVPGATCTTVPATTTSYTVSPIPAGHTTWTARVRGVNTSCSTIAYSSYATSTFNLVGGIAGRFYVLPNTTPSNPSAGSNCTLGGATLSNPGTGAAINITDVQSNTNAAAIAGTGYSASVPYWSPGGNNIVQFTPGTTPSGTTFFKAICPATAQYSGVNSPLVAADGSPLYRDFYFAEVALSKAWFQTLGGSLYAGLTTTSDVGIRSFIPTTTCTSGGCVPFVITQNPSGVSDTAGIAMTGGSAIDTNSSAGTSRVELTQRPTQTAAIGTRLSRREDFEYFARLYDINGTELNDFDGTGGRSSATAATKPTTTPRSGKSAYYTPGDMTISGVWDVASGEEYTIFVAGDLLIQDPSAALELIRVAQGGFLAMIVQGDIRIANSVGHQPPYTGTQANIEGMFVADGQLIIEADTVIPRVDRHFIGEGVFVGWGGVNLNRDYSANPLYAEYNNTLPAESFIFRPDFVLNVPPEMNNSTSQWQEVS